MQAAKRIRIGALVAVALLIAFVAWLLLSGGDDSGPPASRPAQSTNAASPLTEAGLINLASSLGRRTYWIGPRKDARYELTSTPAGRTFVRYLPAGVDAGDPRPNFLTVATYPLSDPVAAVRRAGREDDAQTVRLQGGAIAVTSSANPTSAYYARPDSQAQIEVFHPKAGEAMRLVLAGEVRTIR